jgi:hypothetical protein
MGIFPAVFDFYVLGPSSLMIAPIFEKKAS